MPDYIGPHSFFDEISSNKHVQNKNTDINPKILEFMIEHNVSLFRAAIMMTQDENTTPHNHGGPHNIADCINR